MSDTSHLVGSPIDLTTRVVRNGWHTLLTVYYANSVSWRVFKSGALLFFGFFLWAGANVLLSYKPSWWVLHYPMAYGFVLVLYGPFHHLVVIPLALRWRRSGDDLRTRIGRRLPNGSLVVFLAIVLLLGTVPGLGGPMAFDFDATLEDAGADINPNLLCTKATSHGHTEIHCHLTEADGIATVSVESSGEQIAVDEHPPFDFTIHAAELEEVVGQKQFQVVLRDDEGAVLRRYTRTVQTIPEAD